MAVMLRIWQANPRIPARLCTGRKTMFSSAEKAAAQSSRDERKHEGVESFDNDDCINHCITAADKFDLNCWLW